MGLFDPPDPEGNARRREQARLEREQREAAIAARELTFWEAMGTAESRVASWSIEDRLERLELLVVNLIRVSEAAGLHGAFVDPESREWIRWMGEGIRLEYLARHPERTAEVVDAERKAREDPLEALRKLFGGT